MDLYSQWPVTLLKPDGLVVLNLPSSRGFLFRVASFLERLGYVAPWERLWQRGFASPHVSYFAPGNLERLAALHTDLRVVDRFRLPSVSRRGLRERIAASHDGVLGVVLFAMTWFASFLLPLLPSDIEVTVLQRPRESAPPTAAPDAGARTSTEARAAPRPR